MATILIATTLFAPDLGVGAIRVTAWAKFMAEQGWTVVVLKRRPSNPEALGQGNIHIYPRAEESPGASSQAERPLVQKLLNKIKAWAADTGFFVPDTSIVHWRSKKTRKLISNLIRQYDPDVILSSSPHHGVHSVGLQLKKEYPDLIWVADFRDPYLIDNRFSPKGVAKICLPLHKRFEESVYREAHLVVHAIPAQQRYAKKKYRRSKCLLVENGYPEEVLSQSTETAENTNLDKVLTICSMGAADMEALKCAALYVGERKNTRLVVGGGRTGSEASILRSIAGASVRTLGLVDHERAICEITRADILLCSLSQKRSEAKLVSSKLYEYIATGKPVVLVRPSLLDRELIQSVSNVIVVDVPSRAAICKAIEQAKRFSYTDQGRRKLMAFRARYSRRPQSQKVEQEIARLL